MAPLAPGTRSNTSATKPMPPYLSIDTIALFSFNAALKGWPCSSQAGIECNGSEVCLHSTRTHFLLPAGVPTH